MVAKYAIEQWSRVPVEVELSHEFRYREPVLDPETLVVSISQSGETMDTLMAVKYAREQGARTISVCNTQGATIPRESDAVVYTHAGPEVAVASTKAFVAQITALYLFGLHLARVRGTLDAAELEANLAELQAVPGKLEEVLGESDRVAQLAHWMADTRSVLFLGAARGLPDRARGRAEAQGARIHPRRGLRGGRAQARADRAHRAGPARVRRRAEPARVAQPAPEGRFEHPGDPGARCARHRDRRSR